MRVLLAEDGRVNQMVAIRLLEERGHSVVLAEDGQVAVDIHRRERFDAILMDVHMPRMDGYAAVREIRKREQVVGEHTPIIAMTANAMKGDREKCLEAGMDDYLAKPVRSQDLFSVLEKYAAVGSGEPATGTAHEDIEIFDRQRFRKEISDPDLMRELIDIFAEETDALFGRARQAIANDDSEALHASAHSLKGAVGNYSAKRAVQAAIELDELARSGDLTGAEKTLGDCEDEVARVQSALLEFRTDFV